MATLLIATPFLRPKALGNYMSVSDMGGVQALKRLRVSCRQASVSATGEGHRATLRDIVSSQDEVSDFQPSSTQINTSLSDWIVNFLLKEDVHEQAPQAVPAPTFQLLEPVADLKLKATKLHQGSERHRSERTVVFTEEKARRLRKENRATQTFHDKWYHSAIASRLAIPE